MMKDWTHLFEKHRGKWVALAKDETTVLAAADSAREAHREGPEAHVDADLSRTGDARGLRGL
jgi:hypothetical protein